MNIKGCGGPLDNDTCAPNMANNISFYAFYRFHGMFTCDPLKNAQPSERLVPL